MSEITLEALQEMIEPLREKDPRNWNIEIRETDDVALLAQSAIGATFVDEVQRRSIVYVRTGTMQRLSDFVIGAAGPAPTTFMGIPIIISPTVASS